MKRLTACLLAVVLLLAMFPHRSAFAADAGQQADPAFLSIYTASISLKSDLSINFYVDPAAVAGCTDVFMRFEKPIYDNQGRWKQTDVTDVSVFAVQSGYRIYTLKNIAAREIGTTVTATLYGTCNGVQRHGMSVPYGVRQYAENQLKTVTDIRLRRVLVNLLNYGTAAQAYWGYCTDAPANGSLSDEVLALTADQPIVWYDHFCFNGGSGATAFITTCSLTLKERVSLNYFLDLSACSVPRSDLELVVRFGTRTVRIPGSMFLSRSNGSYVAQLSELSASQMRSVCVAEVRRASTGETLSPSVSYSIQTYAKNVAAGSNAKLTALVCAMMRYGDSTMDYFRRQDSDSADDAAIGLQGLNRDVRTGECTWSLQLQSESGGMIALDQTRSYSDLKLVLLCGNAQSLADGLAVDGAIWLLKGATLQGSTPEHPVADPAYRPQVVQNYLGSGKTAMILELDAERIRRYAAAGTIRPAITLRTATAASAPSMTAFLISKDLRALPETLLESSDRFSRDHYDMDADGHSLELVRTAVYTFPDGRIDEGEGEI